MGLVGPPVAPLVAVEEAEASSVFAALLLTRALPEA